jgi:prepilin-type N-terminal cleavage/methylation domain-containing protein
MKLKKLTKKELEQGCNSISQQKGFTLFEMLGVLAVIGIVAIFAIPNMSAWIERNRVEAVARQIYFDLQFARSKAIRNHNNVIVSFQNTGTHQYTIHVDTNDDGTQDAGEDVNTVTLKDNIVFGVNSGVSDVDGNPLSSGVSMGGDKKITFNSRGSAEESGSVYVLPSDDLSVKNDLMRAVSVVQATGAVEYWKYSSGASPGPWA